MPADLIIYAIVAVVLVVWLKNTLGTQGESDEPIKTVRSPLPNLDESNIASAALVPEIEETAQSKIEAIIDDKGGIIGIDGQAAENGIVDILDADKSLDLKFFFGAVQDVFVMVVESFADGDRDTLGDVLGDDVYAAFDAAITQRESEGQSASAEVIAISKAEIIDAELSDKRHAKVTVRFLAEQTHCVYDADKNIIEGHAEKPEKIKDIWVFGRDLKSRDPRWLVVETRGDFEGDNDIIPNA